MRHLPHQMGWSKGVVNCAMLPYCHATANCYVTVPIAIIVNNIVRLCDVNSIKAAAIESAGHPNEAVEVD